MKKVKWFITLILGFVSPLMAEGHNIQIMLTNPRSVSTAFERSMMARGDFKILHEPWNSEYVYRTGNLDIAPPLEIVEAGGYAGIKKLIYRYAEQTPVYVKDMIWMIADEILNDEAFLSDPNVVISLLIRHPARSVESFFLKIGEKVSSERALELTRLVFRYDSLVNLAKKYHEIRGQWPVLVEAEALCARPEETMRTFCEQAGITYLPDALAWEKGMSSEWSHLERWHTDAAESEGFFVPTRETESRFSQIPEEFVPYLESIYQEQVPYYEELKQMIETSFSASTN